MIGTGSRERSNPVLKPTEHDLDPVLAFIAPLVISSGDLARVEVRNAAPAPFAPRSFTKPVGVIASNRGQANQKSCRAGVVNDLGGEHEEPDPATTCVGRLAEQC